LTCAHKPRGSHEPYDPLAGGLNASLFEHGMNAWTPVEAAVIQKDLLNFSSQPGIFSTVLRGFAVFPARIAAFRHFKREA